MLWASTSTKNPDYPDVLYVEELIGPDTVNTMPEETSRPTRTTASPSRGWSATSRGRGACSSSSSRPGVDYDDVTDTLEREGVEKFSDVLRRAAERARRGKRDVARRRLRPARSAGRLRSRGSGTSTRIVSGPDGKASASTVNTRKRFAAVGVGAARGDRCPGDGPRLFLTRLGLPRPPRMYISTLQPDEAAGQAQVALVVLDREHEAADRAAVQAQVGVHGREHEGAADVGEQLAAPPRAVHVTRSRTRWWWSSASDGRPGGGRVARGDGLQQRAVALDAADLDERAGAALAVVDQLGDRGSSVLTCVSSVLAPQSFASAASGLQQVDLHGVARRGRRWRGSEVYW